ncbi:MAG: hypothetical protein AVDCRST_MAG93-7736 [uncultured Chloroflexia bacterium]|uniref:Uncharacterized protein n=1 Tax=uncultured Chloroflexia bacterium TaxID=1672391 RepID=A0A6J4MKR9_9CHLR|nr:MAG: hypothetical protein AVDCRST_MAG93-7736 [uncultured Chloroflexia bacterium]
MVVSIHSSYRYYRTPCARSEGAHEVHAECDDVFNGSKRHSRRRNRVSVHEQTRPD